MKKIYSFLMALCVALCASATPLQGIAKKSYPLYQPEVVKAELALDAMQKAPAATQGLQYDAEAGELIRYYNETDQIAIDADYLSQGNLYIDIMAADYSDHLSLLLFVEDTVEGAIIPEGTYPITSELAYNTALASQGCSATQGVIPCAYYPLVMQNGQLYINTPMYFMQSGNIVVEHVNGTPKITINAVNSNNVPMTIVFEVGGKSEKVEVLTYTSTDGNIVTPHDTSVFGANIVSNTYENGVGTITFDGPVTSIGDWAFNGCMTLKSILIPNSVTAIGDHAFSVCFSLTSIMIGKGVANIDPRAFSSCQKLTSMVVDAANPVYDSRENCNAIIETATNTLIQGCQKTVIPQSVKHIGEWAFEYCKYLSSITIPNSVISIGEYAFNNCQSLTSVTIPNSVTSIGLAAFSTCDKLTSMVVDTANPVYDSRENCNAIIETSTNTLIAGCSNTIIPQSIIRIGEQSFLNCNISSITIPNSVTTIGKYAFADSDIASITIPNSVTTIGEDAFNTCSSLTSVTIPNSVKDIKRWVFANCHSLNSIALHNGITTIGDGAFINCSSLTSITIPNSVTSIGSKAFRACSSLNSVICEAMTPPTLNYDSFTSSPICYIPSGTLAAYQASAWASQVSEFVEQETAAPTTITYELNGGVTNDYGWQTKNDMFQACMADCGITGLPSLEEIKATNDSFTPIVSKLMNDHVTTIMGMEKWDWLEKYIMDVQNPQVGEPAGGGTVPALTEGTADARWRYALAAFFVEGQRVSWPFSADFAIAGTVEAFQPTWKHGFANPTEPTAEWVLNVPYKEGATFDGWYWNADFSGKKIATVNAETTGTLYAKWVEYIPTIAEVRALADDTETKVSGVVNHVDGRNIYIQDYTGGILVCANESATCKVGDKIVAKGVKVIYGGAPEVKNAVIESAEAATLFDAAAFENLAPLVADSLEHKNFATRVTVSGLKIVSYDSYNNPTVQDDLGNQALCYKISLDPTANPVGSKVTVTAVAGWYNGFQFVGDAADIVKPVAGVKENYTYPVREGKYTLENNWVISNMEDNFTANKPGGTLKVRGMAARDGIMYFINSETESIVRVDGETGKMLEPIILKGEHLFEVQEEDGTWKSGVTTPFNDIKFDQAGNCLIGACMTGATKCQTFYIYVVDLATGVCTKLIEDVLWENPGLDQVQFRFDAFGAAGDVTKNGVVMAADANGSWNVYRWLIEDGVAGEGEQVAVLLDPAVDQSLFINAAGYGTAPQIFPQDEAGELFYVDGFNTLPMLFYGNPDEGALLIDDFINVPSGVKVWNNGNDTISMNANFNGLVEFQVGEEYFLLMVAANNTHNVPSTFALYKFADEYRSFAEMEPLWYFPHNGLGTATNGNRTAPVSVEVIDDHTAKLYLYAENNGYASYTFTTNGSYVASTTACITVNSSNTSKGMVSGTGIYKIGDNALLNATPKDGYHFSRWNDGNTQNPRTVKVTEDKTYTADFERNINDVPEQQITYELNGGVTNDYGWMSKADMWAAFCADAGIYVGTYDEVKAAADPFSTIGAILATANAQAILDNAKWDWLETYVMTVQNADANATALVEGTSSAGWRYALAAFFLESQRTSWPKSANFSHAGTLEAFMPVWKHGFANPTDPTAEWVLNAPYKEGYTFEGWYAAADFSSEKVVKIDATTTGTLYAKWVEYIPTIAEVRALADDTETKVAGVVNHVDGRNIYIQDYTGGILVCANESATCKVGDKIVAKGVKVMYGGAPEVKSAVTESAEAASVTAPTVFENLAALVADSREHKYFATNVTVPGLKIVSYDSYNNPTVQDDLGNQTLCYKMVLDPIIYPIGTRVTITAVAGWYNGFQFVGDATDIVKPVAGVKENYTYPVRDGKYTLENNWVISNIEGNFVDNKPGSNDYVRGMAAKDGIMYFINRETESLVRVDGETAKMLEPLKLQGEHLFEVQDPTTGEWEMGATFKFNDIKFDQAGNCLIGGMMTGSTRCQTFFIYIVDLATGVCTKLIEDYLWDNPGLDQVQFRFDAFGCAGDVTKNGVVMAADGNGSWNVYRWLIEDGVAGEGEQVAVSLDPTVDQSLSIDAAGWGTAPQIFPRDEVGSTFYVDGFNTLPMLFNESGRLQDDFVNVPTGLKVWNDNDTISMNYGFNGLVEFQVGEEYFLLMVAMNNVGAVPTTYALYKFADANRMFEGMEPLWYFPHNGMGTTSVGCRTAPVSVEVEGNTANIYLYTVKNGYASYTFNVQPSTHTLTVKSNDSSMGTVSGSGVYEEGENVQIEATAHYGYHFSRWNDGNTQNPRTVKVTEDKTYTAYFERNIYQISATCNSSQGKVESPTYAQYLDNITMTAIPNDGYRFDQWNDGNVENPRIIVLTQDTALVAQFALNQYTITTQVNNSESGQVFGSGVANYGEYVELSAVANYGYHFAQWSDGNTDNPRIVQVTGDATYTAHFDKNTYTVTMNYNSTEGTVSGASSGQYLDNITLTAEANYGYHFAQWSDGVTDNPRTFVLTQDTAFTAEFALNQYTITTQVNNSESGQVFGGGVANYGEYVELSAVANYGYHFAQWSDGNTDNPRIVQVTGDATYTAHFDKNTYTVTMNYNSTEGTVSGASSGQYLDNITLTAEANYGYHFAQWSDGVTDNPRTFVLTQDTAFTAEFALNQYTITTQVNDSESGQVFGSGVANYGEYVELSAVANYGYHFAQWSDGNTDNPRIVQVIGDATYTAYFDKNTYTVTTYCNSEYGVVTPSTSGAYLDIITLEAISNIGYSFSQWSDGNTDNPRALLLTQDTILMAEFTQAYSGKCGDDLYWAYDNSTQTLSISGMGDMYDYTATTQPWVLFKEQIMTVDIANTATSIGTSAFEGCRRIGTVNIGANIIEIGENAFAGCSRLYDIYCYPTYPPFAETSSFANYNVYLYVPCVNIREYEMDIVWGNFKYIKCMGAEGDEVENGTVEVTPSTTSVTITWPTEENANTYIIEIKKDGVVFCRLTFNADGQLLSISFAPGRNGNHPAQYATKTTNGLRFTVTGLEEGTNYTYDVISKDENNESIETYSGEFRTQSNTPTDVDNINASTSNVQKLFRNGQLIIVRDGVEYNAMGQEL